ncbi:MAG TPA: hypothetical protein V6D34_13150 [Candidatus Sericytochromatia bacterium]
MRLPGRCAIEWFKKVRHLLELVMSQNVLRPVVRAIESSNEKATEQSSEPS